MQDLRRGFQVISGKTNRIGFKLKAQIKQSVLTECQLLGLELKQSISETLKTKSKTNLILNHSRYVCIV